MSEESYTTPIAAGQIKKGAYAILKDRPCKIIDISVSKTGKHGHAKVHLVGTDVFTGKKYEDVCPSTHTMRQPILEKTEYTIIDIEDEFLSLLTEAGDMKNDIRIPEGDIGGQIQKYFDDDQEIIICVLSWGPEEAVISCKLEK